MIKCEFEHGNKTSLRHCTVDAIAINESGQILLARRAMSSFSEPGKWALPGGYMDRGERIIHTLVRELYEETGYETSSSKLLIVTSDPERAGDDYQNVTFVYVVQVGAKTGIPDDEISETAWFDLDNLPPRTEIAFNHSEMIDVYLKYLNQPYEIPLID